MEISVSQQCSVFVLSVAVGILIGFWYDIFRIIRKSFPAGTVFVFIQDCIFWIVAAAATFLFVFDKNSGQVRAFILLGEIGGALIYFFTASRPIVFVCVKVIYFIKKIFFFIFKIIAWPVLLIIKPLRLAGRYGMKKIKKYRKKITGMCSFHRKIKKKFIKTM